MDKEFHCYYVDDGEHLHILDVRVQNDNRLLGKATIKSMRHFLNLLFRLKTSELQPTLYR